MSNERKAECMLAWLVGEEFARDTMLGNACVTDYVKVAELPDAFTDPMVDINLIKPYCQKSVFNTIIDSVKSKKKRTEVALRYL